MAITVRRAATGFTALAVAVSLLAACGDADLAPPDAGTEAQPDETIEPPTAVPTETPDEPRRIRFTGNDDDTTDPFTLVGGGVTVIEARHAGDDYFRVELINASTGSLDDILVYETGAYEGVSILPGEGLFAMSGEFSLEVYATGRWSVTITQPRPVRGEPADQYSGDGQAVLGPLEIDPAAGDIRYTHSGDGYFGVELYRNAGDLAEVLITARGAADGSVPFTAPAGVYWLAVTAGAPWTISFG